MSVKLPKTIRIAGVTWKIVKDRWGRLLGENRGETLAREARIIVHTGAEEHVVCSTMLHELIHAVEHQYNPAGPALSERQVLALEKGLFATFAENPSLLRSIWGAWL